MPRNSMTNKPRCPVCKNDLMVWCYASDIVWARCPHCKWEWHE